MTTTTSSAAPVADCSVDSERNLQRAGALVLAASSGVMITLLALGVWLVRAPLGTVHLRLNFGVEAVPFLLAIAALDKRDMARRHLKKAIYVLLFGFVVAALGLVALASDAVVPHGFVLAQTIGGAVIGALGLAALRAWSRVDTTTIAWRTGWPSAGVIGLVVYFGAAFVIVAQFMAHIGL